MKIEITRDRLKEIFDYDVRGLLINKVSRNSRSQVGCVAGTPKGAAYWRVKVGYRCYSLHRLIFFYHHGYHPEEVDHINGDRTDNRIENLRAATRLQNGSNRRKIKKTKYSRYKGVTYHKRMKMYQAAITHKRKYIYIGAFENELDAALAYDREAKKLHGCFARLNFGENS